MKQVEIERKWLVSGFPNLPYEREVRQVQGYIAYQPSVVRIRQTTEDKNSTYFLTIKGKGRMTRTEVEVELHQQQFEALLEMVAVMAEKKLRTYLLPSGHVAECSLVDEGQPDAFYYAEVEFSSEEEARSFEAPDWFGREVTMEKGYTMAEYCRKKQTYKEKSTL